MKPIFRYSTEEDARFFLNLLIEEGTESRYLGFTGFEKNEFENYRDVVTIVLEIMNEPYGFIRVRGDKLDAFSQIALLYVAPKHRKKGFATALVSFAEKYIKANFQGIGTEVYTNQNKPMDELLKKNGYKYSGLMKKYGFRNGKFYNQSRWYKLQ